MENPSGRDRGARPLGAERAAPAEAPAARVSVFARGPDDPRDGVQFARTCAPPLSSTSCATVTRTAAAPSMLRLTYDHTPRLEENTVARRKAFTSRSSLKTSPGGDLSDASVVSTSWRVADELFPDIPKVTPGK